MIIKPQFFYLSIYLQYMAMHEKSRHLLMSLVLSLAPSLHPQFNGHVLCLSCRFNMEEADLLKERLQAITVRTRPVSPGVVGESWDTVQDRICGGQAQSRS